jgi:peptidoglycan/LPS O-acetylase OafA/YrhL
VALVLCLVVGPMLRLIDVPFPGDLEKSLSGWVWIYGLNLKIAYTEAWNAAPDYLNHFWSLAVEEQFYLVWPFLVWLTPRRHLRALCVAAILLGFGYRGLLVSRGQVNAALVLMPCRMDTLAIGGLLAVIFRDKGALPASVARLSVAGVVVGSVAVLSLRLWRGQIYATDQWMASAGFFAYAILFASVLAHALHPGTLLARVLELRALRAVGTVSYALYVFHHPLVVLVAAKGVPAAFVARLGGLAGELSFFAFIFVCSFVLAQLSWWCLEHPLLRVKRRVPY